MTSREWDRAYQGVESRYRLRKLDRTHSVPVSGKRLRHHQKFRYESVESQSAPQLLAQQPACHQRVHEDIAMHGIAHEIRENVATGANQRANDGQHKQRIHKHGQADLVLIMHCLQHVSKT